MNPRSRTILVTGATGKQGGAAVRHLLAAGWRVRALVRNPRSPAAVALARSGAVLTAGDFTQPMSLLSAVKGVHGVFVVPPIVYGDNKIDVDQEHRMGSALIDAAVQARVAHVVFTGIATMTGATLPGAQGKHRIERHLMDSGLTYTLLRPVRFMENYLITRAPFDGIGDGVHRHLFVPDRPMQMIAVDDIGRLAALAFADMDAFGGTAWELAGDAPTPESAAAQISAAVGVTIRYQRLPETEAAALDPDIGSLWKLLTEGHDWQADIPALRRLHPNLKTLPDWLNTAGAEAIKRLIDSQRR